MWILAQRHPYQPKIMLEPCLCSSLEDFYCSPMFVLFWVTISQNHFKSTFPSHSVFSPCRVAVSANRSPYSRYIYRRFLESLKLSNLRYIGAVVCKDKSFIFLWRAFFKSMLFFPLSKQLVIYIFILPCSLATAVWKSIAIFILYDEIVALNNAPLLLLARHIVHIIFYFRRCEGMTRRCLGTFLCSQLKIFILDIWLSCKSLLVISRTVEKPWATPREYRTISSGSTAYSS